MSRPPGCLLSWNRRPGAADRGTRLAAAAGATQSAPASAASATRLVGEEVRVADEEERDRFAFRLRLVRPELCGEGRGGRDELTAVDRTGHLLPCCNEFDRREGSLRGLEVRL